MKAVIPIDVTLVDSSIADSSLNSFVLKSSYPIGQKVQFNHREYQAILAIKAMVQYYYDAINNPSIVYDLWNATYDSTTGLYTYASVTATTVPCTSATTVYVMHPTSTYNLKYYKANPTTSGNVDFTNPTASASLFTEVIDGSLRNTYLSPTNDFTNWQDNGAVNRYKLFDEFISTQSTYDCGSTNTFTVSGNTLTTSTAHGYQLNEAVYVSSGQILPYSRVGEGDIVFEGSSVNIFPKMANLVISTSSYFTDSHFANTNSIAFSKDGSMLFVLDTTSSGHPIHKYVLSTNWDVTTAIWDSSNSTIFSTMNSVQGLYISQDGLYLAIVDHATTDRAYTYTMSTAFKISTLSFLSQSSGLGTQENQSRGISFSPDGMNMFVVGANSRNVSKYVLSSPWVVSTATYNSNLSTGFTNNTRDLFVSADGHMIVVVGNNTTNGNTFNKWILGKSFDLSTATLVYSLSTSTTFGNQANGLYFSSDFSKMFIGSSSNVRIYQLSFNYSYIPKVNDYIVLSGVLPPELSSTTYYHISSVDSNYTCGISTLEGGTAIPFSSVTYPIVTGSISGTVLTVTAVTQGSLQVGQIISGTGVTDGTYITSIGAIVSGNQTYNISTSQTVASTQIVAISYMNYAYDLVPNDFYFACNIPSTTSLKLSRKKAVKCSAVASTDTFTASGGHFFANGNVVYVDTTIGGVTSGTTYYVITSLSNTFQLSTTLSGSSVNITSDISSIYVYQPITYYTTGSTTNSIQKALCYELSSSENIDTIGLSNMSGNNLQIKTFSNGDTSYTPIDNTNVELLSSNQIDYDQYFFDSFEYISTTYVNTIKYGDIRIFVVIKGNPTAGIGALILGSKMYLGFTLDEIPLDFISFTTKTRNSKGDLYIKKLGETINSLNYEIIYDSTIEQVKIINKNLKLLDGERTFFIGDERDAGLAYEVLLSYGILESASQLVRSNSSKSKGTIKISELT